MPCEQAACLTPQYRSIQGASTRTSAAEAACLTLQYPH
jgi:hypothetical protein